MFTSPKNVENPGIDIPISNEVNGDLEVRIKGMRSAMMAWAFLRVKNHADAEEIVQIASLKIIRKYEQLENPDAFPGWVRQIVNRTSINFLCRRREVTSVENLDLEGLSFDRKASEPFEILERARRQEQVINALSELSPMDSEMLRMHYLRHHSLLEISEALSVPVGTVKRRLFTARNRFERIWQSLEGQSSDID